MNWTQILRIAWKDYRRIGGLWLIFVGFWLLCLSFLTATAFYTRNFVAPMTVEQTIFAALSTAMIYALAWAGLTFSAEHEDGTYGFLRSLPLHAKQVFYGKLFFGVNSTILLLLALGAISCLYALVLAGRGGRYAWGTGDSSFEAFGAGMMGITIPLVMAVGLFCSLGIRRPLLALALTGVTAVLVSYVCVGAGAVLAEAIGDGREISDVTYGTIVLGLTAVVLLIVDRCLVVWWLPNYSILDAPARPTIANSRRRGTSFGRLFWLHRRQNLSTYIILGAAGAILVLVAIDADPATTGAIATFFSGVLGVIAFYHDHRESRYRLLAQLAVRPFEYWASRLLMPAIAMVVIVGSSFWGRVNSFGPSGSENWQMAMTLIFCPLAVFSIAQFFSIAYASIVVSVATTLISSILACFWIVLCLAIRVPGWLTFLPIVLLPLLASYLRVSRWFRDTGSWRQWVVPAIPLSLLIFGVPLATAMYRVYEVPSVEMPPALTIVPPEPSLPEQDGALAYQAVFANLPSNVDGRVSLDASVEHDPELVAWTKSNRDIVEDLVAATQGATIFPNEYRYTWQTTHDIVAASTSAAILLISGQQAVEANEIDRAWEYFKAALNLARHQNNRFAGIAAELESFSIEYDVYRALIPWAMMPENTAEKVESAAEYLDDYRVSQPAWTDALTADYRNVFSSLADPMRMQRDPAIPQPLATAATLLPWELARAKRLFDYIYTEEFRKLQQAEAGDFDLGQMSRPRQHNELEQLVSTTLFGGFAVDSIWPAFVQAEHVRRGAIYQLAAIAYHRKNGSYPTNFSLVKVGNRPLPDDVFIPGSKLALIVDDELEARIQSVSAGTGWTYSDGEYEERHFLLPNFDDWNAQRFSERLRRTTSLGRKEARVTLTESRFNGTVTDGNLNLMSLLALEGRSNLQQITRRSLEAAFGGYDAGYSPAEAHSVFSTILLDGIRDVLTTGEDNLRIEVLRGLRMAPESVHLFLPEIAPLLDSENLALAVRASQVVRSALISGNLDLDNESLVGAKVLFSSPKFGVPIKNHTNGHYYELVRETSIWEEANQAARQRTYRGMQGHLVTITSAEEEQFLSRAFVDLIAQSSSTESSFEEDSLPFSAWTGGSDSDQEGVWRWVCGPESGKVFWRQSDDEQSVGFANWLSSQPTYEAGEDYLLWESNLDGENLQQARWRSVDRDALKYAAEASYFVEYSPAAELEPNVKLEAESTPDETGATDNVDSPAATDATE